MSTRVRSFCKINLGLAIGPPRPDGFHALATLYQTLEVHDVVTIEVRSPTSLRDGGHPSISLTTHHPRVPTDSRNTAWKMVERALERMGIAAEVAIHLEKDLPVQGGLGAGSANAAAALIGLERELGTALPDDERLKIAAEVGSDVPLFLIGGAVRGTNRGEQVEAMNDLPPMPCVIAVPGIGVSTPHAFQEWDAVIASHERLTGHPAPDRLEELSHVYASVLGVSPTTERASESSGIVRGLMPDRNQAAPQNGGQGSTRNDLAEDPLLALVRTGIENDFEQVVFPQYPLLREIKRLLVGDPAGGALYAALSGSGSALFGLYRNEEDARAAQQRVQASGCKAIVTGTLPRAEYWGTMFAG